MAAVKRLLSQARRTYFSDPAPRLNLPSLYRRSFSSESDPPPPPPPTNRDVREPLPIQPVSYEPKPKPAPEPQPESQPEQQTSWQNESNSAKPGSWGRDEMRYMKDSPAASISPVAYPSRVAPLPEDRVIREEEKNDELVKEMRVIEEERWRAMRGRFGRPVQEEDEDPNLPFPRLIKVDNAENKPREVYDVKEAIRLAKANARKTFDETLEAHVKMTPELRRTDLKLTGFVRFPHGFGKKYRVAVFAEGAAADEAREAGADVVGGPELVEGILAEQVKIDFDKCIATPSMMQHVKKLSRNLKQLMPDPKKHTVTNDMSLAVKEAKEQGVLFKKDKTAIVHLGVGKLSFSEDALRDNVAAFIDSLLAAKPTGLKKSSKFAGYVEKFHICSTMGKSFPVTIQSLTMEADRYNKLKLRVQSKA